MTTTDDFSYAVASQWGTGFVTEWRYTPASAVDDWTLTIAFDGRIEEAWNASVVSSDGSTHVLRPVDWNRSVAAGQEVTFGFKATGSDTTIEASDLDTQGTAPPTPEPEPDPEPEPLDFTVQNAPVGEGDPGGSDAGGLGPLATEGNAIVDAAGETVQIAGVSWFGFETDIGVAHGLWTRNWKSMVDQIAELGFNTVRLPFSGTAVTTDCAPSGIDYSLNPDLEGLNSLQIMDRIIEYGGSKGLSFVLDYHRAFPGDGPNESGRWDQGDFSEADWLSMWQDLSQRYGDNPAVIAADIVNEPHAAPWDEFAAVAETAGDLIHQAAPEWLIFVEGVGSYEGDPYWWGGQLEGVADRPVVLRQPGKVVYSPHDYPASVFDQPWFNDGSDLSDVFREAWGYIHEQEIAPVVVGEMGSKLQTEKDQRWADAIVSYLGGDYDGDGVRDEPAGDAGPGFIWWSFNPNSGDTGGILTDDWRTPDPAKLAQIDPLLDGATPVGPGGGTVAGITVSLAAPADQAVAIDYATEDGTATAGEDYVATAGTLRFEAGEQSKTITTRILPDTIAEEEETFTVTLTGGGQARRIQQVITDDDDATAPPPALSLADVSVDEGAGSATAVVSLSRSTDADVTVRLATTDGTAVANADYTPVDTLLTVPAGAREASLAIPVLDDGRVEADETIDLTLTEADGATIGDGAATVTIADDDTLPVLSAADTTAAEADGAAQVTLSLSAPAARDVTVDVATQDGTATASADYAAVSRSVTIPAGDQTATVSIPIVDDALAESEEAFSLALADPLGATIGDGEATVTIGDDDPAAEGDGLTVAASIVNDWGSGAQVALTVTNATEATLDGWAFTFDPPFTIANLWGGTLSVSGDDATVEDLGWNGRLLSGQSADVGFIARDTATVDMAQWATAETFDLLV